MQVQTAIIIGALVCVGLAGTHGAAYLRGKADAERAAALEAARDNTAAGQANQQTNQAVTAEAGQQGQRGAQLAIEAANVRRHAETYNRPPAPGTVGADARVDPGLARPHLCRIEQLRGIAEGPACRDDAAHRAD